MAGSRRGSRSSSSSSSSKNSRVGAGCLIWLVALCVVFVLVFANLGRIRQTLESTKFLDIVSTQGGREPSEPAPAPVAPAPQVQEEPSGKPPKKPAGGDAVTVGPGTKPAPVETPPPESPAAKPPEAQPEKPGPVKTRSAALYFVKIDGDGVIARHEVKRTIPATDSPLTDAIGSLLRGPGEEELRKELITLIPQGTRLLSAQVRGTTAYLNFSEAFMYNSYGIEGYAGQLKQVVWTATAFPTVQDVQILVEGQRRDFLGGEGVYIGQPLSRNSF